MNNLEHELRKLRESMKPGECFEIGHQQMVMVVDSFLREGLSIARPGKSFEMTCLDVFGVHPNSLTEGTMSCEDETIYVALYGVAPDQRRVNIGIKIFDNGTASLGVFEDESPELAGEV